MPQRQARAAAMLRSMPSGRFPERHVAGGGRQPVQLHGEKQDEQDAEPEGRHAERERAPAAQSAVEPGAGRERADERHRHAEAERDERGARRRAGRSPEAARRSECSTGSRLWIERPRSPAGRSSARRGTEPRPAGRARAAGAPPPTCSGVAFSPRSTATGIARHRIDHGPDERRGDEEHREKLKNAAQDKSGHGFACSTPSAAERLTVVEQHVRRAADRVEGEDRQGQDESGQDRIGRRLVEVGLAGAQHLAPARRRRRDADARGRRARPRAGSRPRRAPPPGPGSGSRHWAGRCAACCSRACRRRPRPRGRSRACAARAPGRGSPGRSSGCR